MQYAHHSQFADAIPNRQANTMHFNKFH